jgi:hypothetical protein
MLDALDSILRLALIHEFHKDKATIKKLTLKVMKRAYPHVQKDIFNDVLTSNSPREVVTSHANRWLSLNQAANEINNLGFVAMILHEGDAYPLRIIIEDENDRQWCLANEFTLAHKAATRFAEEVHDLKKSTANVIFFKNRGFSGVRYHFTVGA